MNKLLDIIKCLENKRINKTDYKSFIGDYLNFIDVTNCDPTSMFRSMNTLPMFLERIKLSPLIINSMKELTIVNELSNKMFDNSIINEKFNKSDENDMSLTFINSLNQTSKDVKNRHEMMLGCFKYNNKWYVVTEPIDCKKYNIILSQENIVVNTHNHVFNKEKIITNILENSEYNSEELLITQDVEGRLEILIRKGLVNYHNKKIKSKTSIDLIGILCVEILVKSYEFHVRDDLNLLRVIQNGSVTTTDSNSVLEVSNEPLMLIINHKQKWENSIERNTDLTVKDGNIRDVFIKLVLKCNTYGDISSIKTTSNIPLSSHGINELLEMVLSGINTNFVVINV
ncbi:Chaperone protein DnaJ [Candidatus Hodgkinia cicadicola]|nr:Chaperone protein DnaJ [Candidatus Hodgkinia cicadicola]